MFLCDCIRTSLLHFVEFYFWTFGQHCSCANPRLSREKNNKKKSETATVPFLDHTMWNIRPRSWHHLAQTQQPAPAPKCNDSWSFRTKQCQKRATFQHCIMAAVQTSVQNFDVLSSVNGKKKFEGIFFFFWFAPDCWNRLRLYEILFRFEIFFMFWRKLSGRKIQLNL